jgi:tagatose 1,6-diphosphate aldolase GatY/KbaY
MKFIPSKDLVIKAEQEGYAIPSFTVWSSETIRIVLETAEQMQSPVILLTGPSEVTLLRPKQLAATAYALAKDYTIPAALHLDHGDTIELVKECIAADYTSLMLDFSAKPYKENVKGMQQVVDLARPHGITVEGEIGSIGKADKMTAEGVTGVGLTIPSEAKSFVKDTNIDMLAVGIGNAHGIYTALPKFDFPRLKEIHELVKIPLVLHGGSGTPAEDLKKSIELGICKVNVASELVKAMRESLMDQWNNNKNLWIPLALSKAIKRLPKIIGKWIHNLGSEGKA